MTLVWAYGKHHLSHPHPLCAQPDSPTPCRLPQLPVFFLVLPVRSATFKSLTSPTPSSAACTGKKCTVSVETRLNQPQPDFTKSLGLHPQRAWQLRRREMGLPAQPPLDARSPGSRLGGAPCLPAAPPRGPARLLPLISVFLYPDCPRPPQQKSKTLCPAQPAAAPPEQLPSGQ